MISISHNIKTWSKARLPSLNALRAFEAAGRHLSFTKAVDELYVTPAAISHQVKALEDYLGVQLFRRQMAGAPAAKIRRFASRY